MFKKVCAIVCIISTLVYANVDTKIKSTKSKLSNYEANYQKTHEKFEQSAKAILKQQKELEELDKQINQLNSIVSTKKDIYTKTQKELDALTQTHKTLSQELETQEKELYKLIAKELSLQIILKQSAYQNSKALMQNSIYEKISRMTKEQLKTTQKKLALTKEKEQEIKKSITTLQTTINSIDEKKASVKQLKAKQSKTLASLEQERASYKKTLEAYYNKKMALRNELKKLHIVKEDLIKKQKAEEKARKEALARKKAQKNKSQSDKDLESTKVKKYGNLYAQIKTTKYKGSKTIAPIEAYSVVKKFGPYTDPIYKIKVFNESVSLKPKSANSVVRSVLNGTVLLAKESSLLGNFVILEHDNGMQTIYAHMDSMVASLTKGKRIKKGHALGRVSGELTFEVIQKNHHIDPLELIN